MKLNSLVLGMMFVSLCVEKPLLPYAIFNRSSDPSEVVSTLVFKDEKSYAEFFKQLGWVQKVEGVTDKVALVSLLNPLFWPTLVPAAMVPKIAERAILDKYLWHEDYGLLTPAEKKQLSVGMDEEDVLKLTTGAAWWWKQIADKKGASGNNPFIVLVRVPLESGGLPSVEGVFELLQAGAKFIKMEIVGSGYINRAAIVNYKGKNQLTVYLPFVGQNYADSIKKEGIPAKDIKWLTVEQGTKQNLLLYEYMTGSNLATVENYIDVNEIKENRAFDLGLSLLFKNNSDHPVHVFFIEHHKLAAILEAGGWTKKSVEQLLDITKKVVAVGADAYAASQGIPIPLSTATNIQFAILQNIVGDFPEKAVQAITVELLKPQDHFENVPPGSLRYSYFGNVAPGQGIYRPATAIKSEFKKAKALNRDLVVAVFSRDEKGLPDFKKVEFIGEFDRREFNGVNFGLDGLVSLINFDPIQKKIIAVENCLSVPIERSGDEAMLTSSGKEAVKKAISKVETSADAKVKADVAVARELVK